MGSGLVPLLLLALAASREEARVDSTISARVSDDLSTVDVEVRTRSATVGPAVTVVLAADRYRAIPPDFPTTLEHEIFPGGHDLGGFSDLRIAVDGQPCAPRAAPLPGGARAVTCPRADAGPGVVEVIASVRLEVPERFGGFGRHRRQLTLAGGWYPYLGQPGAAPALGKRRVVLTLPRGFGAAVGARYFAPIPDVARRIEYEAEAAGEVPIVVLPPSTAAVLADPSPARLISASGASAREPEHRTVEERELIRTLREAYSFFRLELGSRSEAPWTAVVAPLRHELAIPTEGLTLVSDRAFRMTPVERFFRFHRIPIVRALFTTALLARLRAQGGDPAEQRVAAEAAGAFLADQFVRRRYGRAEDAFDVLSFWSFIPAVDLLLYAPDVPFRSAYFHGVDDTDPLTPSFIDFPNPMASGRVLFEKLLDRVGSAATERVFRRVLEGRPLERAITPELGVDTAPFLATWLAPYPEVRYRLATYGAEPAWGACSGPGACYRARVEIERSGDAVSEPILVRLRDEAGLERTVWTESTTAARRVLTATMTAPLSEVELDPKGRLIETPSPDVPSPRLDNRSYARTKVLVNNWNLSVAATRGTVDTALDLGFSREWDVHWRWAVRADYDPASIGLSGRMSYGFGSSVTQARLAHVVGLSLEGAYLRPKFGATRESAPAVGARLYYSFDDRPSIWAAEPGLGLSASLDWAHVFGTLREQVEEGPAREVSHDSLALSARAVRSWRFGGVHELAVRATAGAVLLGTPRRQLLFRLGGRANVRGFSVDESLGEARAIGSVEWVHHLLPEANENAFGLTWVSGIDGALFGDVAMLSEKLVSFFSSTPVADIGYGLRLYIDYFGVRPGVMAIDVAFPVSSVHGDLQLGSPAVYIDFAHSF